MSAIPVSTSLLQPISGGYREVVLMSSGLLVFLICAVINGAVNQSISDPEFLQQAAARLNQIPATIGNWESVDGTITDRERRMAEIIGAVRREYRHQNTGYSVTVTVLSGKAGPMIVHPPTACFQGVGYSLRSTQSVMAVKDHTGQVSELNHASFSREENELSEIVRVFWGWGTDGTWQAPANPRVTLRGHPGLYKLYVVDRSPGGADNLQQAESFMHDALPEIRAALTHAADQPF